MIFYARHCAREFVLSHLISKTIFGVRCYYYLKLAEGNLRFEEVKQLIQGHKIN